MSAHIAQFLFLPRLFRKELKFGRGSICKLPCSGSREVAWWYGCFFYLALLAGIFPGCGILGGNRGLVLPPGLSDPVILSVSGQFVGAAAELLDGSWTVEVRWWILWLLWEEATAFQFEKGPANLEDTVEPSAPKNVNAC